ncbi:MAG: hypothetical protein LBT43_03230 [Prevotella sp.]|jgi:hypothetical protein|nr:hypothetical protein [Prevotella sp.]
MASLELYINNQLCEIESPENFSVYLKRQLLNPAELSTKDAQRSYDISLPATATNNAIFGYTNTEEVRGKFSQLYDAQLLVNGIKIFDGKFKISEIGKDYYKGNLGVPAAKTVKDIFGEKMMNQAGEWPVDFTDVKDMTKYNTGTYDKQKYGDIPPCIFPLVLYRLLQKKELSNGTYTKKDVIDDTVSFGRDDFPPSVNCLQMLEKIFEGEGYTLTGSAFNDERLTNLYVSYKNPKDYEMLWNYGKLAEISLNVDWSNCKSNNEIPFPTFTIENNFSRIDGEDGHSLYTVDLLNSTTSHIDIPRGIENVTILGNRRIITIPYTGLYKLSFDAQIDLDDYGVGRVYNEDPSIISPISYLDGNKIVDDLKRRRFEVKVIKYSGNDPINKEDIKYDNVFYKNNQKQDKDTNPDLYEKVFPQSGAVNFIDQMQNPSLLCGISFGENYGNYNPTDDKKLCCNPMAIKSGYSWSDDVNNEVYAATNSPNYMKAYTENGTERYRPCEPPKYEIDFSGIENNAMIFGGNINGEGRVHQVVWLKKGEKITIVTNSDEGSHYKLNILPVQIEVKESGWLRHEIRASINLELFRDNTDWIKIDLENIGTGTMDWSEQSSFSKDNIDLIKFLPKESKIDEWIENFCKAFNLKLIQSDNRTFELNTTDKRENTGSYLIDLDAKNNVNISRKNNSLGLPNLYELGFTIDKSEQGYIESGDDGGGRFETGSPEDKKISQTSNFSYNWFKTLYNTDLSVAARVPVISDKEVWKDTVLDYSNMMSNDYAGKVQRFWYRKEGESYPVKIGDTEEVQSALLSDTFENSERKIRLDYKNKSKSNRISDKTDSIFDSYFYVLADAGNSYTTVECFLSPEEYRNIDNSIIRFNSDLYTVAEIDGYDPLCKKKATLKLIRKTS